MFTIGGCRKVGRWNGYKRKEILRSTGVWRKKRNHRSRTKKAEKHSSQGAFRHFGFRGKKTSFPRMASFPPKFLIEDLYVYEIHTALHITKWEEYLPCFRIRKACESHSTGLIKASQNHLSFYGAGWKRNILRFYYALDIYFGTYLPIYVVTQSYLLPCCPWMTLNDWLLVVSLLRT